MPPSEPAAPLAVDAHRDRARSRHMASREDEGFMRRALALAERGERQAGSAPIGCVIVLDGQVIGEGFNQVFANFDATAHAEVVAMRQAGQHLRRPLFRGATLYSTLQPCGMCTMASIWSNISRIVFGAERHQVHHMYFEDRHLDTVDFISDAFREDLRMEAGLLADECAALYYGPEDDPPRDEQTNI
jgi:tRNA(adenine34) deaminase